MGEMNFEQARFNMVEQQVRPWDVLDQRVLDAMLAVPREEFAPPQHRALAFTDTEIPLGYGQVMLSPRIVGRLLQALDLRDGDSVLEVGTGSGYVTALLAHLADHVVSVERVGELKAWAETLLARHQIGNVTLDEGDAAAGWEQRGTFDAIALTGSLPYLPESFRHSLNVGGRLFAVVGEAPVMEAVLITRAGAQEWSSEHLFETVVPPLANALQPQRFIL